MEKVIPDNFVRYGSNGYVIRGTEKYVTVRTKNQVAVRKCRSNKKELPQLKMKVELIKKELNDLAKIVKEQLDEILQYELEENYSTDMNSLTAKQKFQEITQLLNDLN